MLRIFLPLLALWIVSCGGRTEARIPRGARAQSGLRVETCNGLDDDGQNGVDDPFRDALGNYVHDAHCGACNQVCTPRPDAELEAQCQVREGLARCVATLCASGFAPARAGRCARVSERLCLACAKDDDCGSLTDARCLFIAGENRCTVSCQAGCPAGYRCEPERNVCIPNGGSCSCESGQTFDLACSIDDPQRDPGAPVCVGQASCQNGQVSTCSVGVEVCDEQDNDCDGEIDEDFKDELGAYARDPAHCGQCGAACDEDTGLDQKLICGGDPFAPRCALACPDAADGVQIGDRLDGDLVLTTGCECLVQALADVPGPVGVEGPALDENCDGADGVVRESFYVAGDGNDDGPGSPTRPLRTIGVAILRAHESLTSALPRPHVFIASGSYTETITLQDGVQVHGGYRRDFRALDPTAHETEVRAPRPPQAPGGAALVAVDVGQRVTRVEWLSLRGLDASAAGGAALGGYLERPGASLVLSDLTLRAGLPGDGANGTDGTAGDGPRSAASAGNLPRAARENAARACIADNSNRVGGGSGGRAVCGGFDVHGGDGGFASCPMFGMRQSSGQAGSGPAGGAGGTGGQDSQGPIFSGDCGRTVCCGLADFSVPTAFEGPRPGNNGQDGRAGGAGLGCRNALGRFAGKDWNGDTGNSGSDGQPGSGGGGGGAGGGSEMFFVAGECEFPDGLGGGGGGGGAGGCGGRGGSGGQSGAPSIALLAVNPQSFTLRNVTLLSADGGRGGAGGAGGDGGTGGSGAGGGTLAMAARTTPTLAGPFPGARGGSGGSGGAGGAGGGGCGGASVGVWVVGSAPSGLASWRIQNRFQLGAGGAAGSGGGGAQSGGLGARGEALDVVVQ